MHLQGSAHNLLSLLFDTQLIVLHPLVSILAPSIAIPLATLQFSTNCVHLCGKYLCMYFVPLFDYVFVLDTQNFVF